MAPVPHVSKTSSGELWDHVDAPSHRGPIGGATHSGLAVNSLCGDEIQIQLRLSAERRIQQAAFLGRGCAVSQGAASLICERVEGLDLATATCLSSADVLAWIGVTLSPIRQRCSLLAFEALTKALSTQIAKFVRLVILDRDDTLIHLPDGVRYISGDDPICLMSGVRDFLLHWNAASVPVAVVTNQQGVALDEYPDITPNSVDRFHDRLRTLLDREGVHIDHFYVCPHAEAAGCDCRKPKPGLFLQAMRDFGVTPEQTVAIGDRERDMQAAAAAGIERRFQLISGAEKPNASSAGGFQVASFAECLNRLAAMSLRTTSRIAT